MLTLHNDEMVQSKLGSGNEASSTKHLLPLECTVGWLGWTKAVRPGENSGLRVLGNMVATGTVLPRSRWLGISLRSSSII